MIYTHNLMLFLQTKIMKTHKNRQPPQTKVKEKNFENFFLDIPNF